MLYSEFIEGTNCKDNDHNYQVYKNLEVMYMNSDMSKAEIYEYGKKLVDNSKSAAEIEAEEAAKAEIETCKRQIEIYKKEIEWKETCIREWSDDKEWTKELRRNIKSYKEIIRQQRNRIQSLKWIIA